VFLDDDGNVEHISIPASRCSGGQRNVYARPWDGQPQTTYWED